MANLPLAFGELLAGGVFLTAGISGSSIADVIEGKVTLHGLPGAGQAASTAASASPGPAGAGGDINPVPGSSGSRLDQGFDLTGTQFLSPNAGKVVYSTSSDPGWQGGGYVGILLTAGSMAGKVFYFAEGITPTVHVGDTVTAGQSVAVPATNPYNGIVGNIEMGLANPSSPGQPLAQVVSDARSMVMQFYTWIRSLGGPTASSTSNAGAA